MALLETKEVRIHFGGLVAVNDVDFSILPREICGLIGPNGSGKTTFFNLITGVNQPSSGKIYFNETDIVGLSPYRIALKGIGRTFQNSRLCLELSVLDNVLIGTLNLQKTGWFDALFRKGLADSEMKKGIEISMQLLAHFSKTLPDNRFKKIRDLPQVDRRKVEICRALASDPLLLLLDEPLVGMIPEETMELMEDIRRTRELKKDISMIIIEHDMMVIRGITERVVVFNHGEKVVEGTFDVISSDERVREAYLGK